MALEDPVLVAIAKAHNRTPAAVIVAWLWQQGIVTNPRSMQVAHMVDNLSAYNVTLSPAEMNQLYVLRAPWHLHLHALCPAPKDHNPSPAVVRVSLVVLCVRTFVSVCVCLCEQVVTAPGLVLSGPHIL